MATIAFAIAEVVEQIGRARGRREGGERCRGIAQGSRVAQAPSEEQGSQDEEVLRLSGAQ